MKPKVVVTRRWPKPVEKALFERYEVELNHNDEPFDRTRMRQALSTADAVLTTVTDILDATVFSNGSTRARMIGNFGVGYSHIDTEAAVKHGIIVTNTPDVLSECTADIAITLMLMVSRRAGEGERELRASRWSGWRPTHMVGAKLTGKTLGIIGFGRIGSETAHRAHAGFGMPILVHSRSRVDVSRLAGVDAEQTDSIESLLERSDFVSLHCPGGDENRHLIDRTRLQLMKPTAFLVNTARGEVIDESALIKALAEKQIAGAGLDVFQNEPILDSRWLELDNAVLLPHLGSATRETREAMGFRVLDNLDAFFSDRDPGDRVV